MSALSYYVDRPDDHRPLSDAGEWCGADALPLRGRLDLRGAEAHLESGDGRMTTAPDPWRPARDVTGIPMETTRRLAVVGEGQARLAPYRHERRRSTVDRH